MASVALREWFLASLCLAIQGCTGYVKEDHWQLVRVSTNPLKTISTQSRAGIFLKTDFWHPEDKPYSLPNLYNSESFLTQAMNSFRKSPAASKYTVARMGKAKSSLIPVDLSGSFEDGFQFVDFDRTGWSPPGHWGFLDAAGNLVIPPIYKTVTAFRKGKALVRTNDNKLVCIDTTGKVDWQPSYSQCSGFSPDGLAVAHKQGIPDAVIDTNGKIKYKAQQEETILVVSDGIMVTEHRASNNRVIACYRELASSRVFSCKGDLPLYAFHDGYAKQAKRQIELPPTILESSTESLVDFTLIDKNGNRLLLPTSDKDCVVSIRNMEDGTRELVLKRIPVDATEIPCN